MPSFYLDQPFSPYHHAFAGYCPPNNVELHVRIDGEEFNEQFEAGPDRTDLLKEFVRTLVRQMKRMAQ